MATKQKEALGEVSSLGNPSLPQASKNKPSLAQKLKNNPGLAQALKNNPSLLQDFKKKLLLSRAAKARAEALASRQKRLSTLSKITWHIDKLEQLDKQLIALYARVSLLGNPSLTQASENKTYDEIIQSDASNQKAIDEVLAQKRGVKSDMTKILMENAEPSVVARILEDRQNPPPMGYGLFSPWEVREIMGKGPFDDEIEMEELDLGFGDFQDWSLQVV